MGSNAVYSFPNERPVHRVTIAPFYLDPHPVTNAEYAEFVEATGYVTVAERPIDWEVMKKQVPPGTPKPSDETLQPGSLVFRQTAGPVGLRDMSQWWVWTIGATWRHPEGPEPVDELLHEPNPGAGMGHRPALSEARRFLAGTFHDLGDD